MWLAISSLGSSVFTLVVIFLGEKHIVERLTDSFSFRTFSRIILLIGIPITTGIVTKTLLDGEATVLSHIACAVAPWILGLGWELYKVDESRIADAKEQVKDIGVQLVSMEQQRDVGGKLLWAISRAVSEHARRLQLVFREVESQPEKISDVAKTLNPIIDVGQYLAESIRLVLDFAIPGNATVLGAMFVEEKPGILTLKWSSNGISKCNKIEKFVQINPDLFRIGKDECSAGLAAATGTIVVDADTWESHQNDSKPFRFIGNERRHRELIQEQRRLIRSVVSIPLVASEQSVVAPRIVICISANKPNAMVGPEVAWILEKIQPHLNPRFQLLNVQKALMDFYGWASFSSRKKAGKAVPAIAGFTVDQTRRTASEGIRSHTGRDYCA